MQFEIPDQPIFVTMIETFEYIEVHTDAQSASCYDDDLHNYCKIVRLSIMKALQKTTAALHYEFSKPKMDFGCPCGESVFHQATISDNGKFAQKIVEKVQKLHQTKPFSRSQFHY